MGSNEVKPSVLIVDDEKDILDALFDTLMGKFEVYKANNADEAMAVLGESHVDLIISDQRMPDTTGVELFIKVEKHFPSVAKILLTGYSDINSVVDAINKGGIDKYITKPWDNEKIMFIILEVLNIRLVKSITERKELESQLVHNAKMASLGELAAGVAHEINNPLGFIYANLANMRKFFKKILSLIEFLENLDSSTKEKKEIEEFEDGINYSYLKTRFIEMIDRSITGSERMKKIILDLKSFSRIDSAEFSNADINEAIDVTLSIMSNELKNRIEVIKNYGDIPNIECNISKLNQVFMNLFINASHAIKSKGEIKIKTFLENNSVTIQVRDNGGGIKEDKIAKIFDPFFTTKPVGVGTGLGLSIAFGIIKQHNGTITVESQVGEGTIFTIILPCIGGLK